MTESEVVSKPKQRRNRLSLNCLNCKRRKIKCDRELPCKQCIKSKLDCEYQQPGITKHDDKDSIDSNGHESRIKQLGIPAKYNLPEYQSELQELKHRIRELEASEPSRKRQKLALPSTSISEVKSYKYNPEKNPTFVGINPYSDVNERINFYSGYNSIFITAVSRRYNSGPFSWLSIMKKDPALFHAWKYLKAQRAEHISHLKKVARDDNEPQCALESSDLPKPIHLDPHDKALHDEDEDKSNLKEKSLDNSLDKTFHAMVMDRDGFTDYRMYGKTKKKRSKSQKKKSEKDKMNDEKSLSHIVSMNKHGISLGLTVYEGTIDKELQLIERLSMVLPKQRVIWTLINKFFALLYPFMPIIDETEFKTEITRILGPEEYNETAVEVSVEKRLDFAYLGIMLVILRLTYLSLFLNRNCQNEKNLHTTDPSKEAQELKYLLSNPINITLVNMAQECLEQFDLMRRTNFAVLQCAFMLKLYRMFAPEDGDGADAGDSQTYNAMLIQMAYSMGINREPVRNSYDDHQDDLKTNNIQRKIWNFLVISDIAQAYQYGNPLNIEKKYYDTSLPFHIPGNENIKDVELEKHVIGIFSYFEICYDKLYEILDSTLNIKKQIKLSELASQITSFEVYLHANFGTLKEFLVPFDEKVYGYSFIKVMKCRTYINMKLFLNTLFYHLFLHYEKQQNTEFAYFYLKKILACQIGEFLPSVFHLIADNGTNFGKAGDLMLNPTIVAMIDRMTDVNFAILVRLNATIYQMKQDKMNHNKKLLSDQIYRNKFAKLTQAALRLKKTCDYFVVAMSKLSQRYYYAWRVTKAHTFVLKNISDDEFYATQSPATLFLELSDEQLSELTSLVRTNIDKNCPIMKNQNNTTICIEKEIHEDEKEVECVSNKSSESAPNPVSLPSPVVPQASSIPTPDIMKVSSVVDNSNQLGQQFVEDEFDWEIDFNMMNSTEIDNLWLQMAQMKNDISPTNSMYGNNQSNSSTTPANYTYKFNQKIVNSTEVQPATPSNVTSNNPETINNGGIANYQDKDDATRLLRELEIFDTLPFERFFGSTGL